MLQLHVCSEKLALREWCTLKKAARLENFFIPSQNVICFSWNFYPFLCNISILGRWGGGGGHLQVLKKNYWPRVNFKVLGPPCLHHQENRITCGTTTLTQTTLPQISSGGIMLVVATHAPQWFVVPRVFHNLIMGPQIQLLKHLFTVPWCLTYDHFFVLWYYASSHYSCRQSKSSNLQTDFLGLQKALELVGNGINELLLMSFINSNEQNFQKWQYKGFIPQKFGACMKNS